SIDAVTGALSFNAAPDFEVPGDAGANNVYDVQVTVSDGNGGTAVQTIAVTVTNANDAPVITSGAAPSIEENTTAVTNVTATDEDVADTLSYAITGGADAAQFGIDAVTGALSFNAAPDFEAPADADANNVYQVQVTVSDGSGGTAVQTINVTVTNANDAPVITSGNAASVAENTTAVATVTATDQDLDTLNFAISGGADAGLFTIDPTTGALSFGAAPDFENPLDAGANNMYDVQVTVSDGNGGTAVQNIVVTVTNGNDAPLITSGAAVTVAENTTAVSTVTGSDPDGDPLSFAISGGADAAHFSIDAATGVLSLNAAQNFEAPADTDGNNTYEVQVTVSDGNGGAVVQNVSVSISDANEAPAIGDQQVTLVQDSAPGTTVAALPASDVDAGDILTYAIVNGNSAGAFAIDPATGAIALVDASLLDFSANVPLTLTVQVTDAGGLAGTATVTVNLQPVLVGDDPAPQPVDPNGDVPPLPVPQIPEVPDTTSGAGDENTLDPQGAQGPTATNPQNGEQPAQQPTEQEQGGWGFVPDGTERPTELAYVPPVYSPKPHVVQDSDSGARFPNAEAVPAELYGALDRMERQIDDSAAAEQGEQTVLSATLKGTSLLLTAGFATWLLRGTSLLASLLSTMPLWRSFDPLPVLLAAKRREEKEANIAKQNSNRRTTSRLDGMFSQSSVAPTSKPTEGEA
ncbi:MAG: cadherin domain-containing protein, partial [Pseudomonadota bacterium]